ncbi:Sel1 repeat-containing protein, partial [Pseudomonas oryzihabitans]
MHRAGRTLCAALILMPLVALAGGNSLLVPSTSRCNLNLANEALA